MVKNNNPNTVNYVNVIREFIASKEFNPNQPRDEDGQWSDGSSNPKEKRLLDDIKNMGFGMDKDTPIEEFKKIYVTESKKVQDWYARIYNAIRSNKFKEAAKIRIGYEAAQKAQLKILAFAKTYDIRWTKNYGNKKLSDIDLEYVWFKN